MRQWQFDDFFYYANVNSGLNQNCQNVCQSSCQVQQMVVFSIQCHTLGFTSGLKGLNNQQKSTKKHKKRWLFGKQWNCECSNVAEPIQMLR